MGRIIAVWGQHGSGKTTISNNLAYMLSQQNYLVGLISTQIDYPSIQFGFGMSIDEDKSLKNIYMATTENYECKKLFTECPKYKNLFLLGVPDVTNYIMFADENVQPDRDKAINMLAELRNAFDYLIIDCDCDMNNALTDFSLIYADIVIHTLRATVQGIVFCKAYQDFLNDLKIAPDARVHVLNMDKNYINPAQFDDVINGKVDIILPYDVQVEKSENMGIPCLADYHVNNGFGRRVIKDDYKTNFEKLIAAITQPRKEVRKNE